MSSLISDGLKDSIRRLFPGLVRLRNRIYNHVAHYRFRHRPIADVFIQIYNENHWNDVESRSGTGSSAHTTRRVSEILAKAVRKYNVKSMLDVPCGDFNWMKNIQIKCSYHGGDIVPEIISHNKEKFQGPGKSFSIMDITTGPLPQVDLIFCRDCFVHFSYADVHKALITVKNSGSVYIMTTTFPKHKNFDIITGNWRPVNLEAPPFSFPAPLAIDSEEIDESGYGEYADKSLGLWRIDQLKISPGSI